MFFNLGLDINVERSGDCVLLDMVFHNAYRTDLFHQQFGNVAALFRSMTVVGMKPVVYAIQIKHDIVHIDGILLATAAGF